MNAEREFPTLDRVVEGALLAFAAAVPVSIALSQIALAVLLIAWLALRLLRAPTLRWRPGYAELAIGLLLAGGILSCLVNRVPGQIAAVFNKHGVLFAVPALAALGRERPVVYRRAVIVAVCVAALVGIYGVWQHFAGLDLQRGQLLIARGDVFMVVGTFNHHLTYGGSVMLALVAALGLAHVGAGIRLLPMMLLPPLALALVWSYARSAWLGALAGTLALLVVGFLGGSVRRLLLVAAALVVLVAVFIGTDASVRTHVGRTLDLVHDPPPRVRIWHTTLLMLRDHPLGIAPGRFEPLFPAYQVPGVYDSTVHAHSDLLRAWTDAGPAGFVAYLLLVPGCAVLAFRGLRRRSEPPPSRIARSAATRHRVAAAAHRAAAQRDLLFVALGASVAFFVAGLLQAYLWDLEDCLFWMLLVTPALAALPLTTEVNDGAAVAPPAEARSTPIE